MNKLTGHERLDELENAAMREREYGVIEEQLERAFEGLRRIAGEQGWAALDQYVSTKNAEAEYMINYVFTKLSEEKES